MACAQVQIGAGTRLVCRLHGGLAGVGGFELLLDGTNRTRPLSHACTRLCTMGNQPSSSSQPSSRAGSNPQSPVASVTSSHAHAHHHDRPQQQQPSQAQQYNPRRRESIQALSNVFDRKAAEPLASLESASGASLTARPRSRGRSATISTTGQVADTLRAAQDNFKSASQEKMGNEQSRPNKHHHHHQPQPQQQPQHQGLRDHTPPKPKHHHPPDDRSAPEKPLPSPITRPLPVPHPNRDDHRPVPDDPASLEPQDASFIVPSSHYSRPPRLPLPIEEEPVGPGSPIISPADITSPINHDEIEGALPRRSSMLSDRTQDDDDLADEFKGPQGQVTVPTLIEWEGPGERVYVTGTFAGWERKFKLHPK